MLRQRLVVDAGGLQSKDYPAQGLAVYVKARLAEQMPNAFGAVLNDQPLEQGPDVGISKEPMMPAIGNRRKKSARVCRVLIKNGNAARILSSLGSAKA
jgi:hypothetical protein